MIESTKVDPIELELRLAAVLGYVDIKMSTRADACLVGRTPGASQREYLPRWARDNGAAYALMVEHKLSPSFMGHDAEKGERRAASDDTKVWAIAYVGEHGNDDEATVRTAIVMGSTAKLEHEAFLKPATPSATGPSAG
jgi:hypothetical protein